jgi:hypothetical protein
VYNTAQLQDDGEEHGLKSNVFGGLLGGMQ